jgi:hypothetical protein
LRFDLVILKRAKTDYRVSFGINLRPERVNFGRISNLYETPSVSKVSKRDLNWLDISSPSFRSCFCMPRFRFIRISQTCGLSLILNLNLSLTLCLRRQLLLLCLVVISVIIYQKPLERFPRVYRVPMRNIRFQFQKAAFIMLQLYDGVSIHSGPCLCPLCERLYQRALFHRRIR